MFPIFLPELPMLLPWVLKGLAKGLALTGCLLTPPPPTSPSFPMPQASATRSAWKGKVCLQGCIAVCLHADMGSC